MIWRLIGVAVGVWMMFAPAVLDYGGVAENNDRIFGPIAGSIAFVAIWDVVRPLRWLVLPVAAWLLVAPLALGFDDVAAVVSTLASAVVLAVTAPFGPTDESFGGGWSRIWQGYDESELRAVDEPSPSRG